MVSYLSCILNVIFMKTFWGKKDTTCLLMISCFSLLAAISAGHSLAAKFVIHVHSPTSAKKDVLEKVETAVKNVLVMADEKNLKSLALPLIGSGS